MLGCTGRDCSKHEDSDVVVSCGLHFSCLCCFPVAAYERRFLAEESGNVDAAGNFSIQVTRNATRPREMAPKGQRSSTYIEVPRREKRETGLSHVRICKLTLSADTYPSVFSNLLEYAS